MGWIKTFGSTSFSFPAERTGFSKRNSSNFHRWTIPVAREREIILIKRIFPEKLVRVSSIRWMKVNGSSLHAGINVPSGIGNHGTFNRLEQRLDPSIHRPFIKSRSWPFDLGISVFNYDLTMTSPWIRADREIVNGYPLRELSGIHARCVHIALQLSLEKSNFSCRADYFKNPCTAFGRFLSF